MSFLRERTQPFFLFLSRPQSSPPTHISEWFSIPVVQNTLKHLAECSALDARGLLCRPAKVIEGVLSRYERYLKDKGDAFQATLYEKIVRELMTLGGWLLGLFCASSRTLLAVSHCVNSNVAHADWCLSA